MPHKKKGTMHAPHKKKGTMHAPHKKKDKKLNPELKDKKLNPELKDKKLNPEVKDKKLNTELKDKYSKDKKLNPKLKDNVSSSLMVPGLNKDDKYNDITNIQNLMMCVMIPRNHLLLYYKMMYDTHNLLSAHSIPYFADGGTALGTIRNGGQIPWDDDLDIGVFDEYEDRVKNVIMELKSIGYGVSVTKPILKIYIPNKWIKSPVKCSANPTLDIFIYKRNRDGSIVLKDRNLRWNWPTAIWHDNYLKPITLYKFGPISIYGASKLNIYCDRFYPNWRTKGVVELREYENADKNKKVPLPYKLLETFVPEYNLTLGDVICTEIHSGELLPSST
jgi:phosphorylcholine metabolism protein LicD